ncbi:dCTP deaminase domain-containing protein [Buttiauxella gaviniae]|uniref:dCTP deaminase domain-containing protein n=1 Tax=Buttiauxella gaviniae TaxID=82990 RepID=UPI003976908D
MSIFSNDQIISEISNNKLIENHDFNNVGPASYELRMGDFYYDLTESDQPISLTSYNDAIIKPGHLVVLITKEKLNIPPNVLGRIISKGSLFSIGLTPVCTNADPGFSGNIGIVTQNISDKYILIPKNESIAKIDFSELGSSSSKPYVGQHGFHTSVWPLKKQLQKNHADISSDPRVKSELEESYKILPNYTAHIIKKTLKYQKIMTASLCLLILLNVGLIAAIDQNWLSTVQSFIISVVASIVVLLFTTFLDRFFKV